MPTVSVVIPTHNRATLLREAVVSVLTQSWQDFEVIVVDDGSTQPEVAGIKALDARIRVVRHAHRGPAASRNVGIECSQGAFVAFLDSDDLWLYPKLGRQLSVFEADAACAAVCADAWYMLEGRLLETSFYERFGRPTNAAAFRARLEVGNPVVTSTMVVRKAVLDAVGGFDETLGMSEDWDLWLRIAECFPIVAVPEPLAQYRIHAGNMQSRDAHNELLRWKLQVIEKHAKGTAATRRRRRQFGAFYREHGLMAFGRGDLRSALQHIATSAFYDPAGFGMLLGRVLMHPRNVWRRGGHDVRCPG
jgi:glycosyltransferase involved in cell wall biosynthesis